MEPCIQSFAFPQENLAEDSHNIFVSKGMQNKTTAYSQSVIETTSTILGQSLTGWRGLNSWNSLLDWSSPTVPTRNFIRHKRISMISARIPSDWSNKQLVFLTSNHGFK